MKTFLQRKFRFLPFLILILLLLACANTDDKKKDSTNSNESANANSTESETTNNQNVSEKKEQAFITKNICSLPEQVAPNTPFANLGGGNWGKWSDSGNLNYGCNDGKDSYKLKDENNLNVTAEYGAIGDENNVRYISAEYTAMQYNGQTPEEKKLREEYADFCDKLSEKFYGAKLPERFKKRLLDESKYSSTGTSNEYAEKVGDGYVNLSSSKNKTLMIMLDVHFFSSEEEYKEYKDS